MRKFLAIAVIVLVGCGDDSAAGVGGSGGGGAGGAGGAGGSGGAGGMSVDAPMIDAPTVDGGGSDGSTGDAGDLNVTGTWINQFTTDNGVVAQPQDLSGATPVAIIGTVVYPGTGAADGSFTIPGVPNMVYTLRNLIFLVTSARVLDLGFDILGRTDTAAPTNATSLSINATGMDAWNANDLIEVYSSNAGTIVGLFSTEFTSGGPAAGATMLTNATIDWRARRASLIQHSKNDSALVLQLHVSQQSGVFYYALTKAFTTSTLEMTDGATATITGTFQAAPVAMATFDWRRSQFAAHTSELNLSTGITPTQFVLLQAQPSAATRGWMSASEFVAPDLLNIFLTATTDATVGPLSYGNPLPGNFDVIGLAGVSGRHNYQLAGTTAGAALFAEMLVVKLRDDFVQNPIVPLLSPPQMLAADSVPATADLTLGSLTPTLSWSAPAVGTPQIYVITLYELTGASGQPTTISARRQYTTTQTNVTIPMTHLVTGHKYVVLIKARTATGVNLGAAPHRFRLPYAEADVLSGILTAP